MMEECELRNLKEFQEDLDLPDRFGFIHKVSGTDVRKMKEWLVSNIQMYDYIHCFTNGRKYIIAGTKRLMWDSEMLKMKTCKIDFYLSRSFKSFEDVEKFGEFLRKILFLVKKDCEYIIVRIPSRYSGLIYILQRSGFVIIDSILTFGVYIPSLNIPVITEEKLFFQDSCGKYTSEIVNIARESYKFDRFHNDPIIPKEISDFLHGEWLRNSCKEIAADKVLIGIDVDTKKVASYITISLNKGFEDYTSTKTGTIILVATNKRFRGKNYGYLSTLNALSWFKRNGVKVVFVGTQLANVPASRLYIKSGFNIVETSVTLRFYSGEE